jgi:Fe2+ transport system protein FeoA
MARQRTSDTTRRGDELVECPVCGERFDPCERHACASCPIGRHCTFICCPTCGFAMVDAGSSLLVRAVSRLSRLLGGGRQHERSLHRAVTLADVPAATRVRVEALSGLPAGRHEQLEAYGMAPGRWLDVVQQHPLTIVRVEHTDIALERAIARGIRVAAVGGER